MTNVTQNLSKEDQTKNIVCLLCVLFGDKLWFLDSLLKLHPDYLMEKFERYMDSGTIEYSWGLHPNLKLQTFDVYMKKWGLETNKDETCK